MTRVSNRGGALRPIVATEAIAGSRLRPAAGEAALWAAVLWQVLVDLLSADVRVRQEAKDWLGPRPSPSFAAVCGLAGIDAVDRAHAAIRAVALAPLPLRRSLVPGMELHGRGAAQRWERQRVADAAARAARGEDRHVG